MISVIQNAFVKYKSYILDEKYADPRTKDFFLVGNPGTLLIILACYMYFCLKAGPRFMESRKPFELKNTLLVYNALQVLLSCYMVFEGAKVWWGYNWICQPLRFTESKMPRITWVYFMAKIIELLDTVFFVLRKKNNQISGLHLFHHSIMPTFTWMGVRYFASDHGTLFGLINSFVHIIMYSYYLVAGLGPEYQKYLWWKKHLTALQLVQFGIIFVHSFYPLFTDCAYPKYLQLLLLFFSSCFIYMFGMFYVRSYTRKPKQNKMN